jgi:hypothetical protein
MDAPREVKIAIILSWLVLVLDSVTYIYSHIQTTTEVDGSLFSVFLAGINLTIISITAILILFTARRRNWARIGLLTWTLGSWCLWFYWTPTINDYSLWKWLASGTLILFEFVALILLFFGNGSNWYSSKKHGRLG